MTLVSYTQAVQWQKDWKDPPAMDGCGCCVCENKRKITKGLNTNKVST